MSETRRTGYNLYTFSGMTGVSGSLHGPIIHSVSAADAALRKHRMVSAAGDHGAVNIWKDDDGALRGEFQRFCVTLDKQRFKSKAHALEWLKKWLPRTREAARG